MKKIFTLLVFILVCKSLFSQIYPVPGAQIQPTWVFPIWFEDGSGAKDTLYFCYDPNAQTGPPLDTTYGEKRIVMDTSKFNMFFDCAFGANYEVLKTSVKDSSGLHEVICVWKGYMPLKIKWDRNLFYSDSIPYPNQFPAPRAKGGFGFDIPSVSLDPAPNCYGPLLMTDTVIVANCYATDSIVLGGGFSIMDFTIGQWDGKEWLVGSIDKPNEIIGLKVYPTLISTDFEIENNMFDRYSYFIFSTHGQLVCKGMIPAFSKISVSVPDRSAGLYLLQAINQITGKSFLFKLLKPK